MSEAAEEAREGGLRFLVDSTEESGPCPLAHVTFQKGGNTVVINFVPIALIQGDLLAAFPFAAWSRVAAERELPRRGLVRPVPLEVVCAAVEDPAVVADDVEPMKLWVGFVERSLAKRVSPGRSETAQLDIPVTLVGEDGGETLCIPFAPALADIANEHFAFVSAESGGRLGEVPTVEERMQRLETTLQAMQESLAALVPRQVQDPEGGRGGRVPVIKANPKPQSRPPVEKVKGSLENLDAGVVASARQAGVSEAQLVELNKLLAKPNRMEDAPGLKRKDPDLSESDSGGEEPILEADEELPGGKAKLDPVGSAVVKLTRIVDNLSQSKRPSKELEDLLDGIEGGQESTSSSSSLRSKAAVYQKLRRSLQENPKAIYSKVEELMELDFTQLRRAPGGQNQPVSARAWLEHRSKLSSYPMGVRMGWILSGILDALRADHIQEARARTAVALIALEQASLDQGSWLLSQEILLEDPPPFQSFQGRRVPESWEQATSKLLDERWTSVLTWRLKEKDSYIETRKRLGQGRGKGEGKDSKGDPFVPTPSPKKGGKGSKGDKATREKDKSSAQAES